jgi:hypothetical protein
MGRGIGGLGSNVGPLALFQSTSDRDVTRYALRGPGATTKLRVPRPGLPPRVVEIYPAWRGYHFFIVGDQIVIVEPGSLRIVAVIPA